MRVSDTIARFTHPTLRLAPRFQVQSVTSQFGVADIVNRHQIVALALHPLQSVALPPAVSAAPQATSALRTRFNQQILFTSALEPAVQLATQADPLKKLPTRSLSCINVSGSISRQIYISNQ
ncbi:hypothetical protein TTHERM_000605950 (macronuclear) [Tetrahymena thermophila SB210]|uniref:Uncharacterized protein n=1 Tax=Tetrahymena thermophila (strain SB210) TaxID=312017 RepID=W7XJQ7_TETTS|nr:hypothetical protein TTHERM_000605950 [Tetrahymena thermophila SB210]EWS75816.1 hypothetical protein TTHERM_000605950 [Tetrahymena thermophila SB210]|eukprot:XP_012651630.1 hypothetical protein TTHERM_000605950 [Tetrahymena thermophila SB210]